MKGFTMERLLASLDINAGLYDRALIDAEVSGISTDSRSVSHDDVFFAIDGENFNGADYALSALEAGAQFSIVNEVERTRFAGEKCIGFVDDTVTALGDVASDYRKQFQGTVVGVTGTSGKTTVKEMLRAVLGTTFSVHGTHGNFNNQIGLPLTVFDIDDSYDCAVLEMGMSASGEIAYLAGIARPDIGLVLNVGPAHLEFFENVEQIADAKMELAEALDNNGTAVLNGDDQLIRNREAGCQANVIRFGIDGDWDYRAENIVMNPDGCASFEVEGHTVILGIPGRHNIYNALAAFAVGRIMQVDGKKAALALGQVSAPSMRMERLDFDGIMYINDSYNANPLSMKAAADVLEHTAIRAGGRKIAVLGDMRELGLISDEAHRDMGRLFASIGIDLLYAVGDSAGLYAEGAFEYGMSADNVRTFFSAEDVRPTINAEKRRGDVIFIKGSRALGLERIINGEKEST
ncbi:UDP-N-acetylmuramoyl-tripeptide--D-alanyl-D-alanine ligase [Candidatus Latescibacterota bacterium]